MEGLLGPVAASAFAGTVGVVGFASQLAVWVGTADDVAKKPVAQAEKQVVEGVEAAERSDEEPVDDFDEEEKDLNEYISSHSSNWKVFADSYSIGNRRARFGYPKWVDMIGGFMSGAGFVAVLVLAIMVAALQVREPNYFEIFGVKPYLLGDPRVGSELKRALSKPINPRFGLDDNEILNVKKILRDKDRRISYDVHGDPNCADSTIMDLVKAESGMILFYIFWFWYLLLITSINPRLRSSFSGGGVLLGIAFIVDGYCCLGLLSIRDVDVLNSLPAVAWLTSFQRLCFIRHTIVPILLSTSFFYSSSIFVNMDEIELTYLLRLMAISVRTSANSRDMASLSDLLTVTGEPSSQESRTQQHSTPAVKQETNGKGGKMKSNKASPGTKQEDFSQEEFPEPHESPAKVQESPDKLESGNSSPTTQPTGKKNKKKKTGTKK